jgi:hypothetical protein
VTDKEYNLETARATLDACKWDLESEERRMATIDGKLQQLAAFSGVSISISGAIGGSVLAAGDLPLGFLIALGALLGLASTTLLSGVICGFIALSPKLYHGIDEAAVATRVTEEALSREPATAIATFAGSRRDMLIAARTINDKKAEATITMFRLVAVGFACLVAGLLVTAVGSVV